LKTRRCKNSCKCLAIHASRTLGGLEKNVLTEKTAPFLGVLAGKQGLWRGEKTFYFAFFHVLVVFCVYKLLADKIFRKMGTSKKNRARKPTVGFLFLRACGNNHCMNVENKRPSIREAHAVSAGKTARVVYPFA
jgi:hypothetical protein